MVNDFLQVPFLKSSANSHTGSAPSEASDGELSLPAWSWRPLPLEILAMQLLAQDPNLWTQKGKHCHGVLVILNKPNLVLSWRGFLMFTKIDICPLVDRHDNRTLCFFYKESHKWSNAAINYHKTDRELVAQRIREISPQIHIMLYLKSINNLLRQLIFQLA